MSRKPGVKASTVRRFLRKDRRYKDEVDIFNSDEDARMTASMLALGLVRTREMQTYLKMNECSLRPCHTC